MELLEFLESVRGFLRLTFTVLTVYSGVLRLDLSGVLGVYSGVLNLKKSSKEENELFEFFKSIKKRIREIKE